MRMEEKEIYRKEEYIIPKEEKFNLTAYKIYDWEKIYTKQRKDLEKDERVIDEKIWKRAGSSNLQEQ